MRSSAPPPGTLVGVSDVAVKALTSVGGPLELLASPWLPVAALASARGFLEGEAVPAALVTPHGRPVDA